MFQTTSGTIARGQSIETASVLIPHRPSAPRGPALRQLQRPWAVLILLPLFLLFLFLHLLLLAFFLVFLATFVSHACSLFAMMTRDGE